MSYTVTLPSNITHCHMIGAKGHYYRFPKSATYTQQHASDGLGNASLSVSSNTVTITKPTGIDVVHIISKTGHYYRFDKGVTSLPLQHSSDSNLNGQTVQVA